MKCTIAMIGNAFEGGPFNFVGFSLSDGSGCKLKDEIFIDDFFFSLLIDLKFIFFQLLLELTFELILLLLGY